jgi:glutaredoxin 3
MARIQVYETSSCGYCRRAKALLERKGLAYERIDVTGDHVRREWLVEATGRHTVPQIFIDGEAIGGYAELSALDRAGRLDQLLAEPQ